MGLDFALNPKPRICPRSRLRRHSEVDARVSAATRWYLATLASRPLTLVPAVEDAMCLRICYYDAYLVIFGDLRP